MTVTVYVALLGEGVEAWRPVQAEPIEGDLYRLNEPTPDGEAWPFNAGDVVRCRRQTLSGDFGASGDVLVAYEKQGRVPSG